ncbi:MAG: hypothetical protein WC661_06950 [Opitutaceae bacterium]|jgi:hypothetical protein
MKSLLWLGVALIAAQSSFAESKSEDSRILFYVNTSDTIVVGVQGMMVSGGGGTTGRFSVMIF